MCTVIVLRDVVPELPVVIAANRDELLARPSDFARWEGDVVLSGVDRVSGGTWMGATRAGLFVAVTNQHTGRPPDSTRRSRGAVVRAALAAGTRDAVRALVAALEPADYNGFNLVWGDATGVELAYVHPGGPPELQLLPAGITVIANDRIDVPDAPRAARATELARATAGKPWRTALAGVLADHAAPICIHSAQYGTRSATLAAIGASGLADYLVSAEAPCRSPLVDARRLV